jgi:hypothetical protein
MSIFYLILAALLLVFRCHDHLSLVILFQLRYKPTTLLKKIGKCVIILKIGVVTGRKKHTMYSVHPKK